jgi:hypothetical protein
MNEEANRMDCAQFEEIVHDLDRRGTQGMALREIALVHAESCSGCAKLMTQTESLDFALQSLASRELGAQAPLRVEAALLEVFRRGKLRADRRRTQWRLAALAAAATMLVALGLSLRQRPAPNPNPTPAMNAEAGVQSLRADVAMPQVAPQARERKSEATETDLAEYATAYVSLPYASDPDTLEGGAVVRVVLSRPALASLGLPVTDVGSPDQIPADIVLGEDGVPQAIRLVSQATID